MTDLIPIGEKVTYTVDPEVCPNWSMDAVVTGHVEGWLELEFVDESRAIVRPSRVSLRNPQHLDMGHFLNELMGPWYKSH